MAGTNIVAARSRLIAVLEALAVPAGSLEGVNVSYSYVAKKADLGSREYIYGGPKSTANLDLSAMKGSARMKRIEEPDWTLHVRVVKLGEETTLVGDTRAVAIGAVIENYVAANPTLGDTITGLIKARISGWEFISYTDDKQTYSELDYTLAFESYLT